MKIVKAICLLLLSLACAPVCAQFSIREAPKSEILMEDKDRKDTVVPVQGYNWDYVNDAEKLLAKKALRKERNLVEFTSKLSLSQTSFDNWASGGDNTLNTRLAVDFKHVYNLEKFNVETKFNTKYGFNYIDKKRFKNEDYFEFNLKPSWKMHKNWSFSQNTNLRSQYSVGYNNRDDIIKRSAFMAPGYLSLSGGITYSKKPLVVLFSPIDGNARFVLDRELSDKGQHGVDKGKRVKWQAGPSLKVNFEDEYLNKVLHLKSELYTFSNLKSDPKLNWHAELTIRATKFLSTTLYGQVVYDELANTPIPKSFQYKYAITIDLIYTFKNK